MDGRKIKVSYAALLSASDDFRRLAALETGEVARFEGGRAIKLSSDATLEFGDVVIRKGNVAADYPGVYSLWLRKTADGWALIFNAESDIWGTQRAADSDVASVDLEISVAGTDVGEFVIELEEAPDGGRLRLEWGEYQWMAPFELVD